MALEAANVGSNANTREKWKRSETRKYAGRKGNKKRWAPREEAQILVVHRKPEIARGILQTVHLALIRSAFLGRRR